MPKKPGLDERELKALREAVDRFQAQAGERMVQSEGVQRIIRIVEDFLRSRRLICYGGTAINNILPKASQFYDKRSELPDYDFFSPHAYDDAIALADKYADADYIQVEAKSGVHHGTYKVFVNFLPIADVTQLAPELFRALSRDPQTKTVEGIRYAPPNYLRMAMYLELSRPRGDISRWEKVLKRLSLLNYYYPLKATTCKPSEFMREFEGDKTREQSIYHVVRDSIIDQGLVFFGGYAASMYSKHMSKAQQKLFKDSPDFDVLSRNPKSSAEEIREKLVRTGLRNVKIVRKPGIGEVVAPHYEVRVGLDIVCFVYEPLACHSYNAIKVGHKIVKIATIDTMLSFYLAFLYADRSYYDHARLLCMAEYLFAVQAKNRYAQKGMLKRFTSSCYGVQQTLTDIREEKSKSFERLRSKRGSREWNERFLNYVPEVAKRAAEGKAQAQAARQGHAPLVESSALEPETVRGYTHMVGKTTTPQGARRARSASTGSARGTRRSSTRGARSSSTGSARGTRRSSTRGTSSGRKTRRRRPARGRGRGPRRGPAQRP